ncbi:CAP domain-containing protein [Sphingomonas sp. 4RDLI-65]|uniref:CAP domain-containing protein n=1 Tax=Sphingomonas sp. 4RDLI-65 TaxID=3111641 RepID=UPI003C15F791
MTIRMGLAVAAALLVAGCAQGPERVVERRETQAPAPRGAALLKTAMMDGHNAARAEVGVPPLVWSDTLATTARAYAEEMTRTGKFAHAHQPQDNTREGENLWTGTRYAYTYAEMMGHWVAEKRDFINGVTPDFSRTGKFEDVAHYTQIVWRNSTAVGCAIASNKTDDYLVCRYSPPGNVIGQRSF